MEMVSILGDKYKVRILMSTSRIPRSANYLISRHMIPVAACYRSLRELKDNGLLIEAEKVLTPGGKRVALYRSRLNYLNLTFDRGIMRSELGFFTGERESSQMVV